MGKVRFIMDTTHPTAPHFREDRVAWRAELEDYCARASFSGLTLLGHEVDEDRGRAHVTFTVALHHDGRPSGFTERSLFLRDGNRWRYVSGEIDPPMGAQ